MVLSARTGESVKYTPRAPETGCAITNLDAAEQRREYGLAGLRYPLAGPMTTATKGENTTRTQSVESAGFLALLVLNIAVGVAGLTVAMDWLAKGEPSEQFPRTRWFQRRRAPG